MADQQQLIQAVQQAVADLREGKSCEIGTEEIAHEVEIALGWETFNGNSQRSKTAIGKIMHGLGHTPKAQPNHRKGRIWIVK